MIFEVQKNFQNYNNPTDEAKPNRLNSEHGFQTPLASFE